MVGTLLKNNITQDIFSNIIFVLSALIKNLQEKTKANFILRIIYSRIYVKLFYHFQCMFSTFVNNDVRFFSAIFKPGLNAILGTTGSGKTS